VQSEAVGARPLVAQVFYIQRGAVLGHAE
jgi:hypothetical protein